MPEQNLTAVEALAAFARRHTDDRAVQALVDAATLELAGRTVVRPDQHAVPRRFVLRRGTDISGISGTGDVADGVLWPDGTAAVRWRGEHPSAVHWDRGQASVELIHGHQGATEIVWLDQGDEPAAVPTAKANPAAASLRLRRVVDHALNKPVPCPKCKRSTTCGCMVDRAEGRIDAVLAALAPWLADGTAA
ncbi:hypothetical protein [Streptomyces sp. A13(2022)]|uniref:hypothetical protein n=1 Tax=Streptomyces sp. A13(2022) TaxID=2964768 RepID=UPI0021D8C517|nr:hypothetical protein [Streptomyces sp. A13(2022)]MCU8589337.1 hypothetical protein [Streptomyces sp. A13(2022)]